LRGVNQVSYKITAQKQCDLAVIGGGGGGMVAAARAAWLSGKKVIVLEKTGATGGGAAAAGAIRTFGSQWQKNHNLPDVTQEFILDGMDKTYWRLDHTLVANCFRATGEYFDWFCEVGNIAADQFEVGFYVFDGPDGPKVPLLKNGPAGRLMMKTMLDVCTRMGVEVLTGHRAVDVEVTDGRISAVIADTGNGYLRVTCRVCVIASGSWIRNEAIMRKYAPKLAEVFLDPEWHEMGTISNRVAAGHHNVNYTGDGIALAGKARAFIDYDSFCLRVMGPTTMCKSEVLNTMGNSSHLPIMVNLNGNRWVCEHPQIRMGAFNCGMALMEQPKGVSYSVFDENILAAAIEDSKGHHEGWGGSFGFPKFPETMDEVRANMEKAFRENNRKAFKAETLEELASKLGVPPVALKQTVDTYNASCEAGTDREFFKPAKYLVPMNKGPYYAVQGELGSSGAFGGVRVNPDMQAYRNGGGLVEGLYAVGDFASGRHLNMSGMKMQIINDASWAFASGFIAGNSVSKYLETGK
jgi:fumarate reductase flavoprotein subunit